MRTVFFHQGALGDFLLAVGAFESVCAARSGLVVDFWSKPEHVSLLFGREYLGEFHSLENQVIPALLNDSTWERVPIPDFLARADEVLIFGQDGSRLPAERLSYRLGSTKVHWVRSFPAGDSGIHVHRFVSEQLERLSRRALTSHPSASLPGTSAPDEQRAIKSDKKPPPAGMAPVASAAARPRAIAFGPRDSSPRGRTTNSPASLSAKVSFHPLSPPDSELSAAESFFDEHGITSPPILIHPGSGGRKKTWPLRNWRDLLCRLRSEIRLPVLLSLGPADAFLDEFARSMEKGGAVLVSGLSLLRLAALISKCRFYMGVDSGVSHLAAATGTPSIVIFGPTDPGVWAPVGERVRIVRQSWREQEIFNWSDSDSSGATDPELKRAIAWGLA